jgi:hypothetical protein
MFMKSRGAKSAIMTRFSTGRLRNGAAAKRRIRVRYGSSLVPLLAAGFGCRSDRRQHPTAPWLDPRECHRRIARDSGERHSAMVAAYATGAYTYRETAEHSGVHLATVGRYNA